MTTFVKFKVFQDIRMRILKKYNNNIAQAAYMIELV